MVQWIKLLCDVHSDSSKKHRLYFGEWSLRPHRLYWCPQSGFLFLWFVNKGNSYQFSLFCGAFYPVFYTLLSRAAYAESIVLPDPSKSFLPFILSLCDQQRLRTFFNHDFIPLDTARTPSCALPHKKYSCIKEPFSLSQKFFMLI